MSNIIDSIQLSGITYQIEGDVTVDAALDSGSTNPVENKAIYNKFDEVEQVTAAALNELNDAISGKVDTSTYNTYTAATDTALNGKQPTLVSGTNIKTINNQSILGSGNIDIQGGGKAIEAGRGIAITTGETADTVSFNLPISAGTGNYTIIGGKTNTVIPQISFAFGERNEIYFDSTYSSIFGYNNKIYNGSTGAHILGVGNEVRNGGECAICKYNTSSTGSTDADKTLFSVGNGTGTYVRHNAFEIRQNGDIYCSDGTNDVKLQDTITATAANTTALGGLSLIKLTQAEYDALVTKDNSTLYVIVD